MSWWSRLWSSKPAAAPTRTPEPARSVSAPPRSVSHATPESVPAVPTPDITPVTQRYFLPWPPVEPTLAEQALSADERAILTVLNDLLKLPTLPDTLLPRAAELVPQLIALLREADLPLQAVAQRIGKDALLTAEVLRLASSSYYRAQREVTDLVQAIQLIGAVGLRTAIARVVLKPIYRDSAGLVNAHVIARLALHAENLADVTAQLAEKAGHARFDGYLTGMLHDTGWRVALRAVERAGLTMPPAPSRQFASDLTELTHRLFGLAGRQWAITPAFTALAQDALANGLAGGQHPLAPIVEHALQQCLPDPQADAPAPVQ